MKYYTIVCDEHFTDEQIEEWLNKHVKTSKFNVIDSYIDVK